jgi:hypothetical protein
MKTTFKTLLIFSSLFFMVSGVNGQVSDQERINTIFGKELEVYFSFKAGSKAQVNSLSRSISIDNVTTELKVFAYANRKEFAEFLASGLNYEILPHPGDFDGIINMKDQVNTRQIKEWDFYPTYEGYVDMMFQFAADYPDLCRVYSIGTTNDGRELLIANISDNVGLSENEPEFLYTSSIHGDETTGYILMLRLIDYLLSNYGTDPKCTNIVDNIDLSICPLANPDGTYYGGNNTVNGARRYNSMGVDLNRNYPDPAAGPHPDGNQWQTETIHFMNLAGDNHFNAGANIHGGAEVCNYPWDTWAHLAADDDWWYYVCREYADTVHVYSPAGYMTDLDNGVTNGYAWYTITGGRQDYMNYFQQCREFTLEISDIKLLPANQLPAWWEYNYRSLLNFIEQSTFGVRGTVKDASTGWPVEAEVYAVLHEEDSSWTYSTLPGGNYHRLLPEGSYTMRYSAPGYETAFRNNVTVVNRQATIVDVLLNPNTGVGGLGNSPVNLNVDIFPNPLTSSDLNIKSAFRIDKISIFDLTGKQLITNDLQGQVDHVDLGRLSNGIYFLRLWTETGEGIKKIVISR